MEQVDHGTYRLLDAADNQPLLQGLFVTTGWAEKFARERGWRPEIVIPVPVKAKKLVKALTDLPLDLDF